MNPRQIGLGLLVIAGAALATPRVDAAIYRCGNVYSERPCAEGRVVEADDPRTVEQRNDARRVAAEDRQRTAALERERLARERAAPNAARLDRATVTTTAVPAPVRHRTPRRARGGRLDVDDFVAFDASTRKKRRAD